jgi:small-conductance mechanosensitive channel
MDPRAAPIAGWFPPLLTERAVWGLYGWQWLTFILALAVVPVAAVLLERALLAVGRRLARLTSFTWDNEAIEASRGPARLLFGAGLLYASTRPLWLPPLLDWVMEILARSGVVVAVSWFLLRFLRSMSEHLGERVASKDPEKAERARAVQTQLAVLRRVLEVAIWLVGAALLLMQFDVVRNMGVSLLASAGIAGLVIGFAAQKSLSNLLAGIQLSMTQPIRIGDSVVVEGDFGTVEEITLTFVVVRVWDLRRIVMPISHFLEKPFQNWSRGSNQILGAVTFDVDFTTDVEVIRREVRRVLEHEGHELWDGKVAEVAVTDATERTIRLRALMSAPGPDTLWKLRCLVRERVVAFVVTHHPDWLARTRTSGPPSQAAAVESAGAAPPPPQAAR